MGKNRPAKQGRGTWGEDTVGKKVSSSPEKDSSCALVLGTGLSASGRLWTFPSPIGTPDFLEFKTDGTKIKGAMRLGRKFVQRFLRVSGEGGPPKKKKKWYGGSFRADLRGWRK